MQKCDANDHKWVWSGRSVLRWRFSWKYKRFYQIKFHLEHCDYCKKKRKVKAGIK